jgi:hypothetical protein
VVNNDTHLDDGSRSTIKTEPYDGKGSRAGGNHVMSGEPLFMCPKFGLTATSYCYGCSNFNGLKKDRQGNMGECDLYPGARERIVAQVAREQPPDIVGSKAPRMTAQELEKIGARRIFPDEAKVKPKRFGGMGIVPRTIGPSSYGQEKKAFQKRMDARTVSAVENDFKKSKKKMDRR